MGTDVEVAAPGNLLLLAFTRDEEATAAPCLTPSTQSMAAATTRMDAGPGLPLTPVDVTGIPRKTFLSGSEEH